MSLPLIGMGHFWGPDGSQRPAAEVLKEQGLEPIELAAKDGLSLINGTQFMAAYAAWILYRATKLVRTADILATMSLEALQGSSSPFDPRVHDIRPHVGTTECGCQPPCLACRERNLGIPSGLRESAGSVLPPVCTAGPWSKSGMRFPLLSALWKQK